MSTPRKKFNYNSPYANQVQQYPSQSEDYISLDMGGPMQKNNAMTLDNERTPDRYNLKYYHQQSYRNSSSKSNKRNLCNNNYGQQTSRQSFNEQQRYGPRNSNEKAQQKHSIRNSNEKRQQPYHHNEKNVNSIASYCHPSMTEDPWFELMQRIRALEKSRISLKETSPAKNISPTPPACSSPENDNDQDVNSSKNDLESESTVN